MKIIRGTFRLSIVIALLAAIYCVISGYVAGSPQGDRFLGQ